jgi:DNA-binding transcriptional regulator YdaS (Cro superfamily)
MLLFLVPVGNMSRMETLRDYINSLSTDEQSDFASRANTTIGFLRKAISVKQKLGEGICIRIEAASNGEVKAEDLRPDVPWHVIRGKAA